VNYLAFRETQLLIVARCFLFINELMLLHDCPRWGFARFMVFNLTHTSVEATPTTLKAVGIGTFRNILLKAND